MPLGYWPGSSPAATVRPVRVRVFAIRLTMTSWLVSGRPARHARAAREEEPGNGHKCESSASLSLPQGRVVDVSCVTVQADGVRDMNARHRICAEVVAAQPVHEHELWLEGNRPALGCVSGQRVNLIPGTVVLARRVTGGLERHSPNPQEDRAEQVRCPEARQWDKARAGDVIGVASRV